MKRLFALLVLAAGFAAAQNPFIGLSYSPIAYQAASQQVLISQKIAAGGGALTLVQSRGGTGSTRCDTNGVTSTTQTCTFSSTPGTNNLIVATCAFYNFTGSGTQSISDNKGNTYTQRAVRTNGAHYDIAISDAIASTSSATFTVTCTCSLTTYLVLHIYEVSGNNASSYDQTGTNFSDSSSASGTVSSGSTGTAAEIVFGSFSAANATTSTAGTGYTLGEDSTSVCSSTVICSVDVYKIVSSTGVQTPTVNWSPNLSTGYSAVVGTYK